MRRAWGITLRDSYGQTETTMMVGNAVGQRIVPGSMGRPLPGYRVVLLDADGREADEGEIALPLNPRPLGLMRGYQEDDGALRPLEGDHYRTGDVASRDAAGYITYVGRADDVFKSSDYRLSPFELESALIEHEAVQEAAVVPAPDPARLSVPKAYVVLAEGVPRSRETALDIFRFLQRRGSRPTSAFAGSNSPTCRRRSPAKSAASNCAGARRSWPRPAIRRRRSSASRISRS